MRKILKTEFFDRSSVTVAEELLGKFLVRERKIGEKKEREMYKIVETEAYEGLLDRASHASRGQTVRNAPMYGLPGTIYVYFTYGMHFMFNIVCGKKGHPAAVLIRGVESCSGPGRLTKKLGIDKRLNGRMLGKTSGLWVQWVEDRIEVRDKSYEIRKVKILRTPRIGIRYAGPIWSKKLYRFVLQSL